MFKNVLVGVDGRPNGRDAIALATRLSNAGGKLTLAHVHHGRLAKLSDVEGDAVYGLAGEELAAFGDQLDLLLVG
jgi:nucleotide-binding universal stress UspA family protein